MNPSITFTINSSEYPIPSAALIKDSVEIQTSLHNELEPTTNKASFLLNRGAAIIPLILAATDNIKVNIEDDGSALFTGYLTDSYTWSITSRGEAPIALSAEDPGIKLLKKSWVSTNAVYTFRDSIKVCDSSDTENSLIHIVALLAGCEVSPSIHTITSTVALEIQDKDYKTYWDVLEGILFEFGYVFFFNPSGFLTLYKIATEAIATLGTIDADNLVCVSGNAIETKKKLRQYKQVKVSWDEYTTLESEKIYEDITGATDTYSCNIELAADEYYPSTSTESVFTYADYSCIDSGNEFIYAKSITTDFIADQGIEIEYENCGSRLKLRCHNTTAATASIRRLAVSGNVLAVKSTNTTIVGESSTEVLKYTSTYLHDKSSVDILANSLSEYYKYSNFTYLFKSTSNYPLGGIVTLRDNFFSGLDVKVILIKKYLNSNSYYSYEAQGIALFNLSAVTKVDFTVPSKSLLTGKQGIQGEAGEDAYRVEVVSSNGSVFRMGQEFSTTLEARVIQGSEDISEDFLDEDFRWYRESGSNYEHDDSVWNDAHYSIGGRFLTITQDDALGRSVFNCELLNKRK
jgi:hypothetical protein